MFLQQFGIAAKHGHQERGQEGQLAPMLTAGNALRCILSQSKGCNQKNVLLALLAGCVIFQF